LPQPFNYQFFRRWRINRRQSNCKFSIVDFQLSGNNAK